MLLDAV
jgi:hypothetical protein